MLGIRSLRSWLLAGAFVGLCSCGGKVVFQDDGGGAGGESVSLAGGASVNSSTSNFNSSGGLGGQSTSASTGASGACQLSSESGFCSAEGTCLGQPVSVSCVIIPEEITCTCVVGEQAFDIDCLLNGGGGGPPCSLETGCCAPFFVPPP